MAFARDVRRCDTGGVQETSSQCRPLSSEWIGRAFTDSRAVLLHSASASPEQRHSFLFTNATRLIQTCVATELPDCFAAIEQALATGFHVAGYMTYEAGALLQGGVPHPLPAGAPLLCFGIYESVERFDHFGSGAASGKTEAPAEPLDLAIMPALPYSKYEQNIAAIQHWIGAGDSYQVNYTIPFRTESLESPQRIYEALAPAQASGYAAVVHLADSTNNAPTILSFSPELFFATDAIRNIITRPMKGTAPRREDEAGDIIEAARLADDEKNRAEHVMIVDLLRNDLGRVCEPGSIQTSNLFRVETYPTLHQMTTDVRGRLRPDAKWLDIFRSLFPSGSITGAPKRRTMEIIHQVENEARGAYTGAIGYIAPDGTSSFSVAIRTLQVRHHEDRCSITMGVGGGIVADSTAPSEYAECLLKTEFVRRASKRLHLIETMRADGAILRFEDLHLARVTRTAKELGIPHDEQEIRKAIHDYLQSHLSSDPQRIRLTIETSGELGITSKPLDSWRSTLRIRLARGRMVQGDPALRHKTNFRPTYDEELHAAKDRGFDESIFANDAGLVTEGCVTNVFLLRGDRLVTPYLDCGVLPGVLRKTLMEHGLVDETVVPLQELESCEVLLLGNSLRGFYPVESLEMQPGRVLTFDTARAAELVRELHKVLPTPSKP